jgi:RNA polymerase sigma factor (sigma-70 family)
MTKSDSTLVGSVLAGDVQAFGPLVTRYQEAVYAQAWSVVRDFAATEDVAQEAFITAYRRLSELRAPSAFAAWLRRITANTARMWLRKNSRRGVPGEMDEMEAPGEPPGAGLREEVGAIAILASLPEKKREAAILCYRDGLSRKDAAHFLGIREATLRKRLHDAKRVLQRRIVAAAQRNLAEHLLPTDFAQRCVCGCKRAVEAQRKEMMSMTTKKSNCGCGCLPAGKRRACGKAKSKPKTGTAVKAGR